MTAISTAQFNQMLLHIVFASDIDANGTMSMVFSYDRDELEAVVLDLLESAGIVVKND